MLSLAILLVPPAPACDPAYLEPMGSRPVDGAEGVPVDARVVAFTGNGWGSAADWSFSLLDSEGLEIQGDLQQWCAGVDSPNNLRCVYYFQPASALAPDSSYAISLVPAFMDDGEWSASFQTGSGPAPEIEGSPSIEVLDAWDVPESELSDCDWSSVRRYSLRVTPAGPDPEGLSLMYLQRAKADGSSFSGPSRTWTPPADGSPFEIEVALPGDSDWPDCLAVTQEDGAGRQGERVIGCLAPAPDTADTGTDTGEDHPVDQVSSERSCGCSSTGPRGAAAWGLALGIPLVSLRRRRRTPRG